MSNLGTCRLAKLGLFRFRFSYNDPLTTLASRSPEPNSGQNYTHNHGNLMSRPEFARNPGNRRIVLAALLVLPVMLPLDPDHLLQEGSISMAKNASADETGKAARSKTTPPARDPEVAVAEEYQAARQRGTAQALELFIARHPDSAYAEKARAELSRMPR
jgi:hypothetical protein